MSKSPSDDSRFTLGELSREGNPAPPQWRRKTGFFQFKNRRGEFQEGEQFQEEQTDAERMRLRFENELEFLAQSRAVGNVGGK